jgi:hypothetical protein
MYTAEVEKGHVEMHGRVAHPFESALPFIDLSTPAMNSLGQLIL